MSWGKKILLITLDGLGDRPAPQLGGRTPLEVAHTPHLDILASRGINGLLHPMSPGIPLSSDVAHYLLFGYPIERRPGRSVFEATGYGVSIAEEEVTFSTSFALAERRGDALWITRRREIHQVVDPQEGRRLVETLSDYPNNGAHDVELQLVYTAGHFGILKARGLKGPVSDRLTDSDPFYEDLPVVAVQPLDDNEATRRTADAVNDYLRWAHKRLCQITKSVNVLLTKWPGRWISLPSFQECYGLKALSISPKTVIVGLARYLGMEALDSGEFQPSESLPIALEHAQRALNGDYDFVHIHELRADRASHKKEPRAKVSVIEAIDAELAPLVEKERDDWVIAITADHSTPSIGGTGRAIHSGDPVPIVIVGSYVRRDDVEKFSERAATRGGLGQIYGRDLMTLLLNYADRLGNYGYRPVARSEDAAIPRPRQVVPLSLGQE
jgi:2,3-bisphosphoglycerate-independent phosphoglycerate mutase